MKRFSGTFRNSFSLLSGYTLHLPERINFNEELFTAGIVAGCFRAPCARADFHPGPGRFAAQASTAAGAAAGLAAHHMAKKGAAGRAAHGKKPNLAERHPIATG